MPFDGFSPADTRVPLGPQVDANRPTYECPLCKVQAMQFDAKADGPRNTQLTDCFICRACGAAWQI